MHASLIVAVQKSDLIPEDIRPILESRVKKGLLGPLSPEREAGPFMLYCVGDDMEAIALKTNFPRDVLYVTAIHYDWKEKSSLLRSDSKDFNPANIQKDLAHTLLVATYLATKEQLQDVLAGRKKASQCSLIPKNVQALDKLMNMVSALSAPETSVAPGGTVVHAQNVQINQSGSEGDGKLETLTDEEMEEKKKEREIKYKALRDKN